MPTTAMGVAAVRSRVQPMCIPPSKRMKINAMVTIRSTVVASGGCSDGMILTATAEATSTSAGTGTLIHSVSRFDSTATSPTAATSAMIAAKWIVSAISGP